MLILSMNPELDHKKIGALQTKCLTPRDRDFQQDIQVEDRPLPRRIFDLLHLAHGES